MREKAKQWLVRFFPPFLLAALFFAIPIEHKYDKPFRHFSLSLVPADLPPTIYFEKKIAFYASDLAALFLFCFGLFLFRRRLFDRRSALLLVFLLTALASEIASPFASYSLLYIRLMQLVTPIALFLFLSRFPLNRERIFMAPLVAAGSLQAVFALIQYFTQHNLGLRLLNEHPLSPSINIPSGRLTTLLGKVDYPSVLRAMGTMSHPNLLGGFLALSLLLTQHLFCFHPRRRLWLAPLFLLQLTALATTYSRGAILSYLFSTLLWTIWLFAQSRLFSKATALLIALSSLLVGALFSEQYVHRGGIVNYSQTARDSDRLRWVYKDIAFKMIQESPVFGIGYNQFSLHVERYYPQDLHPSFKHSGIHNIYLLLGVEIGLIGLLAFLAWIASLFFSLSRSPETPILTAAFVCFLLIGLFDFYPILFQQGRMLLFSLAGLLLNPTPRGSCLPSPKCSTAFPPNMTASTGSSL